MEERIEPSMTLQTEFDEWVESSLDKTEKIINNFDKMLVIGL